MEQTKICSKCGGTMENGYMLDRGFGVGITWNKGMSNGFMKKLVKESTINAYACNKCGFVENYIPVT